MNDILKFLKNNFVLILSIIYIFSPVDIIPEMVVGPLGLIDDAFVIVYLVFSKFLSAKEKEDISEELIGDTIDEVVDGVLEGVVEVVVESDD